MADQQKLSAIPTTESYSSDQTIIADDVYVKVEPADDHHSIESASLSIEMPNRIPNTAIGYCSADRSEKTPILEPIECNLCENRKYQGDDVAPHNKRTLKPCFCNFRVHHGCIVDLIKHQKRCLLCGVQFRYYKYGTRRDFLLRYWYQFVSITSICFFLAVLGAYGLSHSFPTVNVLHFVLLVGSSSALIVGVGFLLIFYIKMFQVRYRLFNLRYGNITVFDYRPEANSKGSSKPKKSELKTLYRQSDNSVYFNVTAGQYLLGHKKNHCGNLHSTPLETGEVPVKFSFDTPGQDLA